MVLTIAEEQLDLFTGQCVKRVTELKQYTRIRLASLGSKFKSLYSKQLSALNQEGRLQIYSTQNIKGEFG